jgi:hypothetical protein
MAAGHLDIHMCHTWKKIESAYREPQQAMVDGSAGKSAKKSKRGIGIIPNRA